MNLLCAIGIHARVHVYAHMLGRRSGPFEHGRYRCRRCGGVWDRIFIKAGAYSAGAWDRVS